MKAIILAAGEGTRLRPYTLDRPKCLVEVDGESLLDRQLDVLSSENINPIILIGGYREEMLQRPGTKKVINPCYAETNMVWTLFCAEAEFEGDVMISYGDIVYSREVLNKLLKSENDIAVTIDMDWEAYWRARNDNPLTDAETLRLSSDGRIIEIGQRPKSLDEIEGQYMGLMKLSVKGVKIFRQVFYDAKEFGSLCGKPVKKAYMTDLIQQIIDSGYRVDSVPVYGGWVEVDTVEDLRNEYTHSRLKVIKYALNCKDKEVIKSDK